MRMTSCVMLVTQSRSYPLRLVIDSCACRAANGALDHGCAAMQAQAIRPALCCFEACAREDRVRVIGVLFYAILLVGCSIPEKIVARHEADKSAENYNQCMAA